MKHLKGFRKVYHMHILELYLTIFKQTKQENILKWKGVVNCVFKLRHHHPLSCDKHV